MRRLGLALLMGALITATALSARAEADRSLTLKSKVKGAFVEADLEDAFRVHANRGTQLSLTLSGRLAGLDLELTDPNGDAADLNAFAGLQRKTTKVKLKKFPLTLTGTWTIRVRGGEPGNYVLAVKGSAAKKFDATVTVGPGGVVELPVSVPRGADLSLKAQASKDSPAAPLFGQVLYIDVSAEGQVTSTSHKAKIFDLPYGDLFVPLQNVGNVSGEIVVKIRLKGWRPKNLKLNLRDATPLIQPNFAVNDGTSHEAQKTFTRDSRRFGLVGTTTYTGKFYSAVAFADFDDDGDVDVFQSGSALFEQHRPNFLRRNGQGDFVQDDAFVANSPQLVHPRKAAVADFNGDGRPDVVVFAHGHDRPPFPGETSALYLNEGAQLNYSNALESWHGFFHSGAAGDIDNDGDIDLFMGVPHDPYFLINDGNARFTEDRDRITAEMSDFFATELVDIDNDGYLDLLSGGEESLTGPAQVLWGSSAGVFRECTDLPKWPGLEIVIDVDSGDVNGDGLTDIVLTRVGGGGPGNPGTYQGFAVQVLFARTATTFVDATDAVERPTNWGVLDVGTQNERVALSRVGSPPAPSTIAGNSDNWIDWVHLVDINDDQRIDIVENQGWRDVSWLSNGDGTFTSSFELDLEQDPDFTPYR